MATKKRTSRRTSRGASPRSTINAQPRGREIGWLYNRSDPALRVFVTEEPDGLFYVWVRRRLEVGRGQWTYAFKTPDKAFRQMRATAGW